MPEFDYTLPNPKLFRQIINDNLSGSKDILQNLNTYFLESFLLIPERKNLVSQLIAHFNEFESVVKYLNGLLNISAEPDEVINKYLLSVTNDQHKIYDALFNNLPVKVKSAKNIITISNSRTISEILIRLKNVNNNFKVAVCESRPQMEGKKLAEHLAEKSIPVKFITEAMLAGNVQKCGAAIAGADKILKSGNAVNKIGSRTLAILCRYFNKPFYIVADRTKFSDKESFDYKTRSSIEIWNTDNNLIEIKNEYFEVVEKELITKIITD